MKLSKKDLNRFLDGAGWIAMNDESTERDISVVSSQISVALLADMFKLSTDKVAEIVIRMRQDCAIGQGKLNS